MPTNAKSKKRAKPAAKKPFPPRDPAIEAEIQAIIDRQGVAKTATYEHLLGIGEHLWESDEELDAFLDGIRQRRRARPDSQ